MYTNMLKSYTQLFISTVLTISNRTAIGTQCHLDRPKNQYFWKWRIPPIRRWLLKLILVFIIKVSLRVYLLKYINSLQTIKLNRVLILFGTKTKEFLKYILFKRWWIMELQFNHMFLRFTLSNVKTSGTGRSSNNWNKPFSCQEKTVAPN